jgi:hypothetical protein
MYEKLTPHHLGQRKIMNTKIGLIASIVVSLNLCGCSDPKVANDKNISAALSDYLAGAGGALCLNLAQWPLDLAPDDLRMMARFPQGPAAEMHTLQQLGLAQSQDIKLDGVDFFNNPNIGKRYTLSEKGNTYYRSKSTDQFGQSYNSDLCFAHKKLERIMKWKPVGSDSRDHPQNVEVSYRYTLTDIAPWINSIAFKATFPEVDTSVTAKYEQITLSSMDKGWWVKSTQN